MIVLCVVLGLCSLLILMLSHVAAYARGYRKAERHFYYGFYAPMASRFERVRRETLDLALKDEMTQAEQAVVLFLEKRRIRGKALKYALKSRKYRRESRRLAASKSGTWWLWWSRIFMAHAMRPRGDRK